MAQSTKHYEVIIIGDGMKWVGVSHSGKKEQTVCVYIEQNTFCFCFIIFKLFILYFLMAASEVTRRSTQNQDCHASYNVRRKRMEEMIGDQSSQGFQLGTLYQQHNSLTTWLDNLENPV